MFLKSLILLGTGNVTNLKLLGDVTMILLFLPILLFLAQTMAFVPPLFALSINTKIKRHKSAFITTYNSVVRYID